MFFSLFLILRVRNFALIILAYMFNYSLHCSLLHQNKANV
jgi:hypothetical protein